jgi:hypothetical protein
VETAEVNVGANDDIRAVCNAFHALHEMATGTEKRFHSKLVYEECFGW